jgi:hypothetical protein
MRKILFIFGVLNDSDVDWMVQAYNAPDRTRRRRDP